MKLHIIQLLFLGLLLLSSTTTLQAQVDEVYDNQIADSVATDEKNRSNKRMLEKKQIKLDNFFVGSGFSLGFGASTFRIDRLPYFGYRLGSHVSAGIGVDYIYYTERNFSTNKFYSMHIYGPKALLRLRPFAKFRPLSGIYAHGEYEYLFIAAEDPYYNPNTSSGTRFQHFNQPRANVGLGYTSNFEKGFGFTTEFLVDLYYFSTQGSLFYNGNSIPFIYRLGIYYGF